MDAAFSPRLAALEVPAHLSVLRQVSAWVEAQAVDWCIPEEILPRLDLCLNEVVANCVTHGGPDVMQAPLGLQLSLAASHAQTLVTLSIADSGSPFDPTSAAPKARAASLADATPGGLGLVMMRENASRLVYRRSGGRNHIDMLFQFDNARPESTSRFVRRSTCTERRKIDLGGHVQRSGNDRRVRNLSWIPLFKDAQPHAVEAVLQACELLEIAPHTPLLVPGQSNRSVYIALSGTVVAHLGYPHRPQAPVTIPLGQCIGELSAIDGKPVSTLVMAITEARVLRIPQEVFWGDLMTLNGVAENFRIILSDRVRKSKEQALQAQRGQMEVEHLTKELQIARQLQISMVPLQRPLFGHRIDLDICGFMEPASAVGGDFFDAFFVRENHLFFCIADVSGHGIASALFMARAMGLIRVLAMGIMEPHKLLSELNARLCAGNDANIFVTMFCGILDIPNRSLLYSNGGHCAPMLLYPGSSRMLPIPKGPLVGAFPGCKYSSMEIRLGHDETLFCYTDGVTEAHDPKGEELTEERCLQLLNGLQPQACGDLLDHVRARVAEFTGTGILEDDCTMLAIRLP
ncbi:MAG: SpoIIE family protein phosphatase [Betaproteobacteria bacterium]